VGERLSELNAHGIPKSRAAVMQAWKRFKPVAHLWLALRLEPRAERTLGTFLARAEGLRQLARKDASLDSVATWAVPVELIAKLPTVEPALPPLTDTKVVRRHWNTYRSHEK